MSDLTRGPGVSCVFYLLLSSNHHHQQESQSLGIRERDFRVLYFPGK